MESTAKISVKFAICMYHKTLETRQVFCDTSTKNGKLIVFDASSICPVLDSKIAHLHVLDHLCHILCARQVYLIATVGIIPARDDKPFGCESQFRIEGKIRFL